MNWKLLTTISQWFTLIATMKDPLNFGINLTPQCFPDQMPKEKEREPHVRDLFDLRILH